MTRKQLTNIIAQLAREFLGREASKDKSIVDHDAAMEVRKAAQCTGYFSADPKNWRPWRAGISLRTYANEYIKYYIRTYGAVDGLVD